MNFRSSVTRGPGETQPATASANTNIELRLRIVWMWFPVFIIVSFLILFGLKASRADYFCSIPSVGASCPVAQQNTEASPQESQVCLTVSFWFSHVPVMVMVDLQPGQ